MWRQCGCYLGDNVYVTLETMWSLLFYNYLLFLMCSCIDLQMQSLPFVATPPLRGHTSPCGHTSSMWPHLPYVATPPLCGHTSTYVATPPLCDHTSTYVATPPLCGHTSPMWPHLSYVATPSLCGPIYPTLPCTPPSSILVP